MKCFRLNYVSDIESPGFIQYLSQCAKNPKTALVVFENKIYWNDLPCFFKPQYPHPAWINERQARIFSQLKMFSPLISDGYDSGSGYIISTNIERDLDELVSIFATDPDKECADHSVSISELLNYFRATFGVIL